MNCDVIVLGATFVAAGIAEVLKERCLILERRPQAGYEFINALRFGDSFEQKPSTNEGEKLLKAFCARGLLNGDRVCLFECAFPFYSLLRDKNVLLNTEIVSVEKSDEGFKVVTHGVSGFKTHTARKIIDTRVVETDVTEKTLNILINGAEIQTTDDYLVEQWGYDQDCVIKCPVSQSDGFSEARQKAFELLENLPDSARVAMVADEFDYSLHSCYPKVIDKIIHLPSCSFPNPILAYDFGVLFAKEEKL